MARTRREVRKLGSLWNPTILWYARAVAKLADEPITNKLSWRYLAAMHNFDQQMWIDLDYLTPTTALPGTPEQRKYWQQCQHQSWYFLPWHRAYLHTFEDILLSVIKSMNGPEDWALPYWNYSGSAPHALQIPDEFLKTSWPDGPNNPLFAQARFGTGVRPRDADLTHRIDEDQFTGTDQGPSLGVGGPVTKFSLGGTEEGLIEAAPHDLVHDDVGQGGLMSDPRTAALDPIFWLHHANIDRLWEVWLARDPANKNPTDPDWLNGPTVRRSFALFGPDGKDRPSNPRDVLSTTALGYVYDDISDPLHGRTRRSMRLIALQPRLQNLMFAAAATEEPVAERQPPTSEVLGSNDAEVPLGKDSVRTRVTLAQRPLSALSSSFNRSLMAMDTPGEPDRVFLHLQNIRGTTDAGTFDVVVHKPGAPAGDPGVPVGAFSLFGVSQASKPDGEHAGNGLNKTLEITRAIDDMKLDPAKADALDVEIVPRSHVKHEQKVKIGQVTIRRMTER